MYVLLHSYAQPCMHCAQHTLTMRAGDWFAYQFHRKRDYPAEAYASVSPRARGRTTAAAAKKRKKQSTAAARPSSPRPVQVHQTQVILRRHPEVLMLKSVVPNYLQDSMYEQDTGVRSLNKEQLRTTKDVTVST